MLGNLLSRRSRPRGERGQALVESVIVIVLLMTLTFGAIELGLGFSQKGTLESAVRTGARTGSARHNQDDMPTLVADAVNAGLAGSSLGSVDQLWVYKVVGAAGRPADGQCDLAHDCVLFTPDATGKQFDKTTGHDLDWPMAHRNACLGTPDRVGVHVAGTYKWITGLIGTGSLTMTADNIQQLEPTNC